MSSTPEVLEAVRRLENNLYDRLTHTLASELGQFRLEVNGRFDSIERRLDRLVPALGARIEELEAGLAED